MAMNETGLAAFDRVCAMLLFALLPSPAAACTLCHSAPAISVRERLLSPDLASNLAAILLPVTALLAIVALVARDPERPTSL
ncbi:hypothetical protein ACMGDM_18845 [Sphingomonas sp. DT-51]|uniref:hypothetical protein n=1 Tax=Sphingomonas sp. DT-51 TaxID=3396165 RepID=UPI003F19C9F4